MKKLFAIVLAVVMVLGIATSAMAFSWAKPADADKVDFGYTVDVIKFTRSTAALGSSSFNADDNATAVNGADVYFTVKLTVAGPSDKVKDVVKGEVTTTAISGVQAKYDVTNDALKALADGVYYFDFAAGEFKAITEFVINDSGNKVAETPVVALPCVDTATAKVAAKVTAKTDLTKEIKCGAYTITVADPEITFADADGNTIAVFTRDGDGKVTKVEQGSDVQKAAKLYAWLNAGSVDAIYNAINNGEMYMTDDNLIAAFGFNFKTNDSVTWNANSTPIILDPTVSIPKTGDSASVVGFAMIMVAIVAAAVAVKKVNA